MKKLGKQLMMIIALVIIIALGVGACTPNTSESDQPQTQTVKFTGAVEIEGENYEVELSLEQEDGENVFYLSINGVSTIDGEWILTEGWGYSFIFNDVLNTEVRAGYFAEEGKHSFDYYLNVGSNKAGVVTLVYEQAGYELAPDYELPVVEAELPVFNGVLSMYGMQEFLKLECLPGGSFVFTTEAVLNASYSGSYVFENGVYTFSFVDSANNVVSTVYSEEKDAYAFLYPLDIGMGAPVTVVLFSAEGLTVEDFEFPVVEPEKEAKYTFTASSANFTSTLTLYDDDSAEVKVLMGENTVHSAEGTYVVYNDTFYVTIGEGERIASTKENGYYVINYSYDLAGNAMTANFKMEMPKVLQLAFTGSTSNGLEWTINLYESAVFDLTAAMSGNAIHSISGTWAYDEENDKYVLTDSNNVVYESTKEGKTYTIAYAISLGGYDLTANLTYTPASVLGSFYGELKTTVNMGGNEMNLTFAHTITIYDDGSFTYVKVTSGSTLEEYKGTYTFENDVYSIVFNSETLQQTLTSTLENGVYTIAFPDPAQDITLTYTPAN